jgi:hypothetical protein
MPVFLIHAIFQKFETAGVFGARAPALGSVPVKWIIFYTFFHRNYRLTNLGIVDLSINDTRGTRAPALRV